MNISKPFRMDSGFFVGAEAPASRAGTAIGSSQTAFPSTAWERARHYADRHPTNLVTALERGNQICGVPP